MNIKNPTDLNINGVTFQSNSAKSGGAVFIASTEETSRKFDGCLFEENEAMDGGALCSYSSAGQEAVTNSVFSGNFASESLG